MVYAKLPRGFLIPTPVGDYNPDWAISFKEGSVKHILFVAETKGTMSSMKLREIENTKIACARKFFDEIGRRVTEDQVKYDVVTSYEIPWISSGGQPLEANPGGSWLHRRTKKYRPTAWGREIDGRGKRRAQIPVPAERRCRAFRFRLEQGDRERPEGASVIIPRTARGRCQRASNQKLTF